MRAKFIQFIKKVYKRFLLHHVRYRVFVLLVCSFIAARVSFGGSFWDSILGFFLIIAMIFPITIYFLDKQIRKDLRFLAEPWLSTPDKTVTTSKIDPISREEFFEFITYIKGFFVYCLWGYIMNFLTRLPFFENYGLNKISHYKYNKLRLLCKHLGDKIKYIYVESTGADNYFYTISLRSNRFLASNKFQDEIRTEIQSYLKREVDNVIIRPKDHSAELLIPIEYLLS